MRRLSALELIELSENGASRGTAGRALLLLESAGGLAPDAAAALTLGMRDRWLLGLRAAQFGARMEVAHRCAGCGEIYELALTAADLGRDHRPLADAGAAPSRSIESDEGPVAVRAVTAGDLAACEGADDADAARALLRARVAPGAGLADAELDAVLAELDPDAELSIACRCPECGAGQTLQFDVAAFVWREIEYRVPRLLQQVADLARLNHWSERDILALPPARRRFYLTAAGV